MGNSSNHITTPSQFLTDQQRSNFDTHLKRMEENVRITYKAHFESSAYYDHWAKIWEVIATLLLSSSSGGIVWAFQQTKPETKAKLLPLSVFGLAGSALGQFAHTPLHPRKKQERHFKAGIRLSSLHKEIQAIREIFINDGVVEKQHFLTEFRRVVKIKQECDEIIQSETWAFEKAKQYDTTNRWKGPDHNHLKVKENIKEEELGPKAK